MSWDQVEHVHMMAEKIVDALQVAAHQLRPIVGRLHRFDADARWRVGRTVLIERLLVDTVRESFHHERAIGEHRQQRW